MTRIDVWVTPEPGGWHVGIEHAQGKSYRRLAPIADGERRYPALLEDSAPVAEMLDAAAITAALDQLRQRSATTATVQAIGRHLFVALLGDETWTSITDTFTDPALRHVELALHLPRGLIGLPWELMRDVRGPLVRGLEAAHGPIDVAITRRVHRPPIRRHELAHPLRCLFVVGTGLSDRLRPGAECFGLLRQVGCEIQDRIVQRISPRRLGAIVDEFRPAVVHVICHGRSDADGNVHLEMFDDDQQLDVPVSGEDLCEALVREQDGQRVAPAVVILSACMSGYLAAVEGERSLAHQLVAAGVPAVIGMGGEIRDLASRLFTRSFGSALVERKPLVRAAARGRGAALRALGGELSADSYDWGLINVVLGSDVEHDLAVRPAADDPDAAQVIAWLRRSDLDLDLDRAARKLPIFCGRHEILEAFYQLFVPERKAVLCLRAGQRRLGKLRTLNEMAAIATRQGHVPVPLLPHDRHAAGYPRDRDDFLRRLGEAIDATRLVYGLPPRPRSQIEKVLSGLALTTDVRLRDALERDLLALRDDARDRHAFVRAADGQVVVLLNNVHHYGDAVPFFVWTLLGNQGVGVSERIPVVFSYAPVPPHDETFKAAVEGTRRSSIELAELRPFESGEDQLAYQRVLLHPFRKSPEIARERLFLNLRAGRLLERALKHLNNASRNGIPGEIDSDYFFHMVAALMPDEVSGIKSALSMASDDDVLRAVRP